MGYKRSFLVPFKYSHKVAYVVEFSHKKIRLFAKNQIVTEGGVEVLSDDEKLLANQYPELVIDSPYGYEDLWNDDEKCFGLQTIQHSDVLYIFNENHPITMLKRYSNIDWRLEELEIKNGPFLAMNTSDCVISSDAFEGDVNLSASEDLFTKNDEGRLLRLRNYDDDTNCWVSGKEYEIGEICFSDNKYYVSVNEATSGAIKPVHSIGVKSDGGVRWRFIHDGIGLVKIIEFVDSKNVKAKVITRLPDSIEKGTKYWELGMLYKGVKHPISGAFFRNRFCFLLNTETGPNVCLSMSGDYNNFSDLDVGEATAETAITVPVLNNEFNEGKWLYAKDVLFVGTGASEFYIDSMTASAPMASDNVKISQISHVGSKAIMPVSVGKHVFFSDRYGLSLRDLMYDYYNEGYDQTDISIFGKHLFASRLVAMSYQEVPDKILWCLMNDGQLIGMTFSSEQEVVAFSRHDFGGKVESMAIVPNLDDCHDDVWIEVKRNICSKNIRTIEKMEHGFPQFLPDSVYGAENIDERLSLEGEYIKNQALYFDGAVIFDRKVGDDTDVINGLEHLEGEKVKIFADGAICDEQVVIDGKVKISKNNAHVVVGLPIKSQFIPQYVFIGNEMGSGIGQRQKINHVLLVLYMSGGGKIGQNEKMLQDIYYRNVDEIMNKSQELFSGHKEILFNGMTNINEKGAQILIENDSPLPMNILAIIPYMDVN